MWLIDASIEFFNADESIYTQIDQNTTYVQSVEFCEYLEDKGDELHSYSNLTYEAFDQYACMLIELMQTNTLAFLFDQSSFRCMCLFRKNVLNDKKSKML